MSKTSTATKYSSAAGTPMQILQPRIALIGFVAALILFGLVMLYSSSSVYSYYENGDSASLFVKQLGFVIVGVILCIAVALIPYQTIVEKLGPVAWIATTVLLAATLVLGIVGLGARRWIDIGFMQLQPSELAKIAMMIVLVLLVDRMHQNGSSKSLIAIMAVAVVAPIVLIALEPDLGTIVIAVAGVLAVLWFGGIPKKHIAIIIAVMAGLAVVMILIADFRQNRIDAFLDPWADPLGSGYQILNSYYAFGDGGIFGVGVGMSRQKFTYLPEAQNDFIFAIVGEELGLVGALAVIALFMGFLYAAFAIARNAPDRQGTMLAGSAAVIVGFQAFLNMLCVVGAAPVTGKPLPFFSAGGTSMMSTMILVGLILSVSLRSKQLTVHERRREELLIIDGGFGRSVQNNPASQVVSKPANGKVPLRLPAIVPAAFEKIVPINLGRSLPKPQKKAGVGGQRINSQRINSRPAQPALSMAALRKNRTDLAHKHAQQSQQFQQFQQSQQHKPQQYKPQQHKPQPYKSQQYNTDARNSANNSADNSGRQRRQGGAA